MSAVVGARRFDPKGSPVREHPPHRRGRLRRHRAASHDPLEQPTWLPAASNDLLAYATPIIGPLSTLIVHRMAWYFAAGDNWHQFDLDELGRTFGVAGVGVNSPLIRSFGRIDRFGFGQLDASRPEAADPPDDPAAVTAPRRAAPASTCRTPAPTSSAEPANRRGLTAPAIAACRRGRSTTARGSRQEEPGLASTWPIVAAGPRRWWVPQAAYGPQGSSNNPGSWLSPLRSPPGFFDSRSARPLTAAHPLLGEGL